MTDMRIYANKKCADCHGAGEVEEIIDTIEVHGLMWDVPGLAHCWCVFGRLEGVAFRYYPAPEIVDDTPF